jgi:uncharacterized protein involved in exopolysaccharide biosynthesis
VSPAAARPEARNWQSVRTILEAAILAALVWAANALTDTQKQIAVLQVNIANLQTQLAGVPQLEQRVTRLETLAERSKGP